MRTSSQNEIRRCRPLLGTFVDIQAFGTNTANLDNAVEAAFAAMTQIHHLMSFQDRNSDVSRLNSDAFRKSVRIHPRTWRVLKAAQEFSRNSAGVFDITMARHLVKWSYLPKHNLVGGSGSWREIVFQTNCNVRFRRRLTIDLGGIAKGFAVDRGVEALKRNGAIAGIVNAGGDLRTFGPASQFVHLRSPAEPTRAAGIVRLCRRAVATSGTYFARKRNRGGWVSPLLDGRTGQVARELISVTVAAAECMTADALTKVVSTLREKAAPLLAKYCADALLLEQNGALCWMFQPPCDTSRQTQSD
jgi:thiamine biosynthesis lipoprotein